MPPPLSLDELLDELTHGRVSRGRDLVSAYEAVHVRYPDAQFRVVPSVHLGDGSVFLPSLAVLLTPNAQGWSCRRLTFAQWLEVPP